MGIHCLLTLIISWFEPVFPSLMLDNKEVIYGKFVHRFYIRNKLNKTNYNKQSNIVRKTNVKNPSFG